VLHKIALFVAHLAACPGVDWVVVKRGTSCRAGPRIPSQLLPVNRISGQKASENLEGKPLRVSVIHSESSPA
jgi:hypothetical protein